MEEQKKKITKKPKDVPFDQAHEISPLILFIIVVPQGQASSIKKLLDNFDTSTAFITSGEGTVANDHFDTVAIGNKKNLIFTIVREDKAEALKRRLSDRFNVSRASAGVAICIRLTSVAGVSVYKFLSNTRKVKKVSKNGK